MILAIVGSRTFDDYELLVKFITDIYHIDEITHIVSGGSSGADSLGEKFAEEYHKEKIIIPAEWNIYGISAGYHRNIDIISRCDECVCFWDGKSRGTKHDISLCKRMNKPCKICYFE